MPAEAERPGRVAIVGGGAIARFLAACIVPRGAAVTLLVRRREQCAALRTQGIVAATPSSRWRVAVDAARAGDMPPGPVFSALFVCVKSAQTAEAVAACLPLLRGDAPVISAQNGLNDQVIAGLAGANRAFGLVLSCPCESVGDTRVRCLTDAPSIACGAVADDNRGRLAAIGRLIGPPVALRGGIDLTAERWSKLALNCATGPLLALTGLTLGDLARIPAARGLVATIVAEVVATAHATGVRPAPIAGLAAGDWIAGPTALADAAILRFAARNPGGRSSLAADYDRGRSTEIEGLLGVVVRRAASAGVATPVCGRLLRRFTGPAPPGAPTRIAPEDLLEQPGGVFIRGIPDGHEF